MDSSKNDELVAKKEGLTFNQLLEEYNKAHAKVMERIAQIPPESS